MLLKPTVPGLCAMLQTIYETESCFSSDSTSSRERPVELLPQSRSTSMPSTGELSGRETSDTQVQACIKRSVMFWGGRYRRACVETLNSKVVDCCFIEQQLCCGYISTLFCLGQTLFG